MHCDPDGIQVWAYDFIRARRGPLQNWRYLRISTPVPTRSPATFSTGLSRGIKKGESASAGQAAFSLRGSFAPSSTVLLKERRGSKLVEIGQAENCLRNPALLLW